jgi:hypothetical protein
MSKRLAGTVHVRDEAGNDHMFTPDDEVPAWAAKQMGDHVWADAQAEQAEQAEDADEAEAPAPKRGRRAAADSE